MNNTDSSKFKRPLSSSSIKNDPDDDLRPPVKLKVKIGGNVVVQPQTANTEKLVSFCLILFRGHSKTTLTIFCPILTTYLPLVDMFTK